MLGSNTTFLVNEIIALCDSTTFFLESVRGERLQVVIVSQCETEERAVKVLRRVVKLYFQSPELPVLYCISVLNVHALTDIEYRGLMEAKQPIGRLFNALNAKVEIKKNNVHAHRAYNPDLAMLLNVRSLIVIEKRYDYWVGGRFVGYISEFFNEESLERV